MYKKKLFLLLFVFGVTLSAEVEDKFKINIGTMFVTNFETDMQMSPKNLPLSLRINTKDQLGMESDTNVFRLDGYYRFSDTHSLNYSYFSVNSNGYKKIDKNIEWNGKLIAAGAIVDSYFDMDVYKINYAYSFYHNEKVELALTAGTHITTISLGLGAKGTMDGVENESSRTSTGQTIPLPVFGFRGEYTILDKSLFVSYQTEYFFVGFDEYRGTLVTSTLNIEYHFIDNVGVGLGYNVNKIFVEIDDSNKKAEVRNNLSGFMLYFSYIY